MVRFREVQSIRQWWISLIMAVPLVVVTAGFVRQAFFGKPWGNHPVSTGTFLFIEAALVAFVVWLHFVRLVTEVQDDQLVLRYVGIWPTRLIPFTQIASARDITYHPIGEYGGWGVRWGWDGSRVYSARGNRGVELMLQNGKRVVVGSQRAEELARAINERRGVHTVSGLTQKDH